MQLEAWSLQSRGGAVGDNNDNYRRIYSEEKIYCALCAKMLCSWYKENVRIWESPSKRLTRCEKFLVTKLQHNIYTKFLFSGTISLVNFWDHPHDLLVPGEEKQTNPPLTESGHKCKKTNCEQSPLPQSTCVFRLGSSGYCFVCVLWIQVAPMTLRWETTNSPLKLFIGNTYILIFLKNDSVILDYSYWVCRIHRFWQFDESSHKWENYQRFLQRHLDDVFGCHVVVSLFM